MPQNEVTLYSDKSWSAIELERLFERKGIPVKHVFSGSPTPLVLYNGFSAQGFGEIVLFFELGERSG